MEEWINCPLGEILNFRRGHDLPHTEMAGGDIPVAGSNGIIGFHNEASPISPCITIGRSGNVGIPFMYNRAWAHNTTLYIDDFKGNDPLYIFYLLKTLPLSSFGGGSAVPTLNRNHIHPLIVKHCTNVSVQRRIASVLKSFDDKIELNNRINHNLEEQAQALYKSWFVDFEPFKGLDFIDSDLGMIPSSLKIKQISTVKHILETGKRPKGGVGDLSFGIPSIGAESIKGLGFFDSSKVKYISEDFARTLKKGWIDGYELLIYKDGGKPGYFIPNYNIFGDGFPYDRMCLNEHVFKLDFLDRGLNAFAYFYFHSEYVFNYLNAQGGKAAIPGINQKDIESLWIFDPNNEHVRLFSERVSPLITTILNNCRCNMELAKTRDMLLPKLMSGELKINDLTC